MIALFKLNLRVVYWFMKLRPVQKKVCFMSWQSGSPSIDFLMLEEELAEQDPQIKTVFLTKRMKKGIVGAISYYFHIYRQMYHMANSSVLVLDSYVPAVSILKHKKKLFIIQLWHSLGAIKKFGLQTVGKQGGRSVKLAEHFNMHKNYSTVISSSEKTSRYYCEAFGCPAGDILITGLPRIDYLINNKIKIRETILEKHPELLMISGQP